MARVIEQVEWLSLVDTSGPFLAASVLEDVFPQGFEKVETPRRQRLRAAYDEWRDAVDEADPDLDDLHAVWTRMVLQEALEYEDEVLASREDLDGSLAYRAPEHGVEIAPDFAVRGDDGKPRLLIAVFSPETDLEKPLSGDSWPASSVERMTLLCRVHDVRIGLVTDGEQWVLVNAPVGSTSGMTTWFARLWWQEPVTLKAFLSLLGVRRFFGPPEEALDQLLERSLEFHEEVTDTLGEQVRRAVEVLIQALGRADQDRNGELLRAVAPAELYEAGLTVMMRLVFILCAEERGLLLLGDPDYDQNYAASTLRAALREEESLHGPEVLERRHDAWSRLLAVFRAVYGGVEHESLRMPALGGSLFDPDRFPLLEGRAKGTFWREEPAVPLPIDNRTVLLLLTALQVLEHRGGAQLLSYRALDVEQIGHVYEGLLEYTVAKLPEVTLGLIGSKKVRHPTIGLSELESVVAKGPKVAAKALADLTGRSAAAIKNALKRGGDDDALIKLIHVCGGDETPARQLLPFAELIRTDSWGHLLVYRAGSFAVTHGIDRRETGTHYTPRSLTESIVEKTLEPIVYEGPADGKPREEWRLRIPAEMLDLKICDPAMGSGAFLVQVCRYLAERLVEAWRREEDAGRFMTVDGEVVESADDHELLPEGQDDRLLMAKRLIAERCLYGVDLNPLAVELAKLSIWLVTLAKGRPFGFLDHNLRCGDSLLGIHRLDQLIRLEMDPKPGAHQQRLFRRSIEEAVERAIELRKRLRGIRIRDIHDVEAMAHLDEESREILEGPSLVADAFIGEVFRSKGRGNALGAAMGSVAMEAERALGGDDDASEGIREAVQRNLSADLPRGHRLRVPFHWPLEFPEVFGCDTPGFHGMVGNPPFMGGRLIGLRLGRTYFEFLKHIRDGRTGAPDLCVYFLLRMHALLVRGGCQGMLATSAIRDTGNRKVGASHLVDQGSTIYFAISNMPWPGRADVTISLICMTDANWTGLSLLDGEVVSAISPALDTNLLGVIHPLKEMKGINSEGFSLMGEGFVLDNTEREALLRADPSTEEIIHPYFSAEDLADLPVLSPTRWIIDFEDRPEDEARKWEAAFIRVEASVKPFRDKQSGQIHQHCYWKFWDMRKRLREARRRMETVLVMPIVSKYIFLRFAPTSAVLNHSTKAVFFSKHWQCGVLHSIFHDAWARWRSGTRGGGGVRYSSSRALDTFPMPRGEIADIALLGKQYSAIRDEEMKRRSIGPTGFYNLVHDPANAEERISSFRETIVALDRAAATAYGWEDLGFDHAFHSVADLPESTRVRFTVSDTVRSQILQRLVKLNQERHQEESG